MRKPGFVIDRHLRRYPSRSSSLIDTIPGHQPPQLFLGRTVGNDQPVEAKMNPRFHEQRRIRHDNARRIAHPLNPLRLGIAHARMNQPVEPPPRLVIRENDLTQPPPIDRLIGPEYRLAKSRNDIGISRSARRHHLMGNLIEIDRLKPSRRKPLQHPRLPRSNPPSQPNPKHHPEILAIFEVLRATIAP